MEDKQHSTSGAWLDAPASHKDSTLSHFSFMSDGEFPVNQIQLVTHVYANAYANVWTSSSSPA